MIAKESFWQVRSCQRDSNYSNYFGSVCHLSAVAFEAKWPKRTNKCLITANPDMIGEDNPIKLQNLSLATSWRQFHVKVIKVLAQSGWKWSECRGQTHNRAQIKAAGNANMDSHGSKQSPQSFKSKQLRL